MVGGTTGLTGWRVCRLGRGRSLLLGAWKNDGESCDSILSSHYDVAVYYPLTFWISNVILHQLVLVDICISDFIIFTHNLFFEVSVTLTFDL